MNKQLVAKNNRFWLQGLCDATPLLGGYIPVAISFGLIASQAGLSVTEAALISALIYAGAAQFLLVGMLASGASLWLAIAMTLLINVRHVVYAPNLARWISSHPVWWLLMHGLSDQIFALAHTRLPQLPEHGRLGWYAGAAIFAWCSWVAGTLLGAIAGAELTQHWPLLSEVMPFALPALFLVLLAPRFTSPLWHLTLAITLLVSLYLTAVNNLLAIPIAALLGAACYSLLKRLPSLAKDK